MTDEPTPHQLSARIARLEGELKASRAENEAMESRIEARLAGMQADMAKRDNDNQRWVIGMFIAAVVIIGILVRWPG